MGRKDKFIRVAIAFVIAMLGLTGIIDGSLETVMLVIAVILGLTAFFSFCPLYHVLGMNTCEI